MITSHAASRGHTRARRIVAAVGLMLATATSGPSLNAADDPEPGPTVTVREHRGVYSVSARFEVSAAPAVVWAVLTDYDHIPQFMRDVKKSAVLERGDGRVVVEQEALSRVMMFSKRLYLVLEIVEGPDTLRFRDRSGRSFARYE